MLTRRLQPSSCRAARSGRCSAIHHVVASPACVPASASSAPCIASTSGAPTESRSVASRLLSVGAAAALAVTLLSATVQPAWANSPLVDSMRAEFAFVDLDKDGYVTVEEMEQLAANMAEERGMDLPSDDQVKFTLGLFDLDSDGKLTSREMIESLGLTLLDEDDLEPTEDEGFFATGDWWSCYLFEC